MTAIQNQQPNPVGHLTAGDIEVLAKELDEIRQDVLESRGAADAAYIRRVIQVQRSLELGSRAVLLFSKSKPAWVLGTTGLALAKILDNMEIGHNVLHGQWDWMRDPQIHSSTWEWDHAAPAEYWKRSHNESHHVYTNILGKDNDLGYGILRVDEDQPWKPRHLVQPLWNAINACDLRVRRRDVRPRARRPPAREARHHPGVQDAAAPDARQGAPAGDQGLRRAPGAVRAVVALDPDRQPDREPGPQRVEPLGDHVRSLPRGCRDLRARRRSTPTRPAASGTSARCSARPTSPARRRCTCSPATCRTRSSTTSSRTCRPTGTPRSRRGCASCSTASGCATTRRRCRSRSRAPGTRCSGSSLPNGFLSRGLRT